MAVKDRLVADVPVGVFLSGGIDSSLIAYYAKRNSLDKIKTFSIGFADPSFDESSYARTVANRLNTEHYERIITADECIKLIPEVANLLDEPIADASIIPTYLLSKFASEHVTVALGGDGGDELFVGYDPFIAHKFVWFYEKIPRFIRNMFELVVKYLPTSFSNMSLDFKIKKFLSGFNGEKRYRNQRWLGAFERSERSQLFNNKVWKSVENLNEFEDIDTHINKSDSKDFFDNLILEYERMYLMDQVLVKVDRASMFNSLEVRAPFLDTRVVELANRLPIDFKLHRLERKHILKKLMLGRIPKEIIFRKKKGFGMPIARWISGDMKQFVIDILGRQSIEEMNLFDPNYVEKILEDHFANRKDNRKQIWTLLMFTFWWRKWFKDNGEV
jgi:asparagine synthase (glutamine-hydrolysing)